jgi:hypothetical protein
MVTIRLASIVLPEPGGPTSSTLCPKRLLSWPFSFCSGYSVNEEENGRAA